MKKKIKIHYITSLMLSDLDKHGFYNKTIHECVLKLHIPLEIVNNIFKNLYQENEVAGVFYVDDNDQVVNFDKNVGDAGSVYTPNNVINYHTHPINAYRHGKTCYGWPSGEDFRETLKFALAGNKAHLVFTVEGLYTIQVSPCKIRKMKELLTDEERGILIFLIEEYFKSVHDFRCFQEVNDLKENDILINPYSFIDFANTFDITNILADKKSTFKSTKKLRVSDVGHTGIHKFDYSSINTNSEFSKIPNMGFPSVTDNHITTIPATKFLTKDDLEDLRKINSKGEESNFNKNNIAELVNKLKGLAKDFNAVPCNIEWNSKPNTWFFVNFFPTEHYIHNLHTTGTKLVQPKVDAEGIMLSKEPFIRVFSNNKDGCKIKKLQKNNNFNMGKQFAFGIRKRRHSTFGKRNVLKIINADIKYCER